MGNKRFALLEVQPCSHHERIKHFRLLMLGQVVDFAFHQRHFQFGDMPMPGVMYGNYIAVSSHMIGNCCLLESQRRREGKPRTNKVHPRKLVPSPLLPQHRPHRSPPGVVRVDAFLARSRRDDAPAAPAHGIPRPPCALGLLPLLLVRGTGADGVAASFSLRPIKYPGR